MRTGLWHCHNQVKIRRGRKGKNRVEREEEKDMNGSSQERVEVDSNEYSL